MNMQIFQTIANIVLMFLGFIFIIGGANGQSRFVGLVAVILGLGATVLPLMGIQ